MLVPGVSSTDTNLVPGFNSVTCTLYIVVEFLMRKTQNTFLFDFFPKQTTKESKWPNHTNATA